MTTTIKFDLEILQSNVTQQLFNDQISIENDSKKCIWPLNSTLKLFHSRIWLKNSLTVQFDSKMTWYRFHTKIISQFLSKIVCQLNSSYIYLYDRMSLKSDFILLNSTLELFHNQMSLKMNRQHVFHYWISFKNNLTIEFQLWKLNFNQKWLDNWISLKNYFPIECHEKIIYRSSFAKKLFAIRISLLKSYSQRSFT